MVEFFPAGSHLRRIRIEFFEIAAKVNIVAVAGAC
jgi:hypothetical protein